jgi:hypothetical protein
MEQSKPQTQTLFLYFLAALTRCAQENVAGLGLASDDPASAATLWTDETGMFVESDCGEGGVFKIGAAGREKVGTNSFAAAVIVLLAGLLWAEK